MRDLAGFAILLLVLLASIYLIGDVVLPLLIRYLLGVFLFFVIATALVLKGRRHPSHLESLLRPGVAPALTALAVLLPLTHALAMWLAGAVEEWWVLLVVNATFPILWTLRLLLAHRRQKVLYVTEGHDIEDLLDRARKREAALEVLDDALVSVEGQSLQPEPWEREVGLGPLAGAGDSASIRRARDRIADLRSQYRRIVADLDEALSEVRARVPHRPRVTPHPVASRSMDMLAILEGPFEETRRNACGLLAEVSSGTGVPGWEDVR